MCLKINGQRYLFIPFHWFAHYQWLALYSHRFLLRNCVRQKFHFFYSNWNRRKMNCDVLNGQDLNLSLTNPSVRNFKRKKSDASDYDLCMNVARDIWCFIKNELTFAFRPGISSYDDTQYEREIRSVCGFIRSFFSSFFFSRSICDFA